jgi:hypothetical protein
MDRLWGDQERPRRETTNRRRRRAMTAVAGVGMAALLMGIASQVLVGKTGVNVLAAGDPQAASTPSTSLAAVPGDAATPSTIDAGLLGSRPPGPGQPCPADASEASMATGSYCGPEPPAGNGAGPDGECTGAEPGPPCGPGVEPGRYYAYTLPGHCDGRVFFDGKRWLSTMPPPFEVPAFHVWMGLDRSGSVGWISPRGAVGFKPDAGGASAPCRETTRPTVPAKPTTTTAPTATTTTGPVCHNSYDDRCGPFRWDPQPDNEPLTVQVTTTTPTARAGEPVTFHVVVDDPDHRIDRGCDDEDFGEDGRSCAPSCSLPPQPHGQWSPPPKQPDHYETDTTHVYAAPGTYRVRIAYTSGVCDGADNPYGSQGTGTATVTITG